jgi:hypothetical protein
MQVLLYGLPPTQIEKLSLTMEKWENYNLDCHRFRDIFHVVFLFYSRYSQPVIKNIHYCSSSIISITTIGFELQYA